VVHDGENACLDVDGVGFTSPDWSYSSSGGDIAAGNRGDVSSVVFFRRWRTLTVGVQEIDRNVVEALRLVSLSYIPLSFSDEHVMYDSTRISHILR